MSSAAPDKETSETANGSTERADVIVIGGGIAALCAAIEAAEAGARVCLLEAAPRALRGGNSRHSRNLRLANERETPWQRETYPAAAFLAELRSVTGDKADADLARRLVAGSAELADWLAAHGVAFQPTAGGMLPWSRKTAFFLGGGKAMVNALYASAEALGVCIDYEVTVPALTLADTAASGEGGEDSEGSEYSEDLQLVALTPAGVRRFAAGALVVASGGYPANRDWLRERWGDAAANFANRGSPYLRGELLRSLLDQGALAVGIPGDCHLVAVDARAPQDDAGIVSRVDGMPLGIVVDRDGERFHDEGEDSGPTRFSHWGQWLTRCPGQIAWLLLDADGTGELPPLLYAPLFAATLAELAARSGIDAQRLAATVAAYNAHVHDTGDDDGSLPPLRPPRTHTPKHPARALRRPPFAAIPMQPGISFTCYGVGVDTGARLRRTDGGRCRRVFAAGMIMAPAILGSAYLSGAALTISAVFGRIAGSNAAIAARAAGRPADAA